MLTEHIPSPIGTGSKPALGFTVQFPSGKILIIYPNGGISQARGDIAIRKSLDGGANWGPEIVVIGESGADLSNIGGGVVGGRFFIHYHKQNFSTQEHLGLFYRYSDDEGVIWEPEQQLSTFPDEHAYGAVVEIGGGRLLLPSYQFSSPVLDSHPIVRISSDGGKTWGLPINVCPPGSGYNETSVVYLGGGYIVALARIVNGGSFRQFKSVNHGEVWTDQGATAFETWSPGTYIESPCWLTRFQGADGRGMVNCFYVNRETHKLRVVSATAKDLIEDGVTAWGTPETIVDTNATDQYGAGYPSAIQQGAYALGWFYDLEAATSTQKIIRFFTK